MLQVQVLGFEWDKGNREKCQKHGLSLKNVENFFKQESLHITPDIQHSQDEQRFLAVGKSLEHRPMFVVFTIRTKGGESLIRPISARYMHKQEAKKYDKETT